MYEVRVASMADIPAMLDIYRPYAEETTVSFEYGAPTAEQFTARIARIMEMCPVLVCKAGNAAIGFAYAAPAFERRAYAWCADLSVYIACGERRRGAGRMLERAVAALCAALGYRRLYALVTEENAASLAFHEAVGYRRVAFFPEQGYKMGRWLGVYWLEKELNGAACAEHFPRSMEELSAEERARLLAEACDESV